MDKLNNDNLKNIVGGASNIEIIEQHKGNFVDKYNLKVGEKYILFSRIRPEVYNVGICVRSYEKDGLCGSTTRTHIIRHDNNVEQEYNGDNFHVFEYIEVQ